MKRDDVIATIQKLLNVTTERGATEGEQANAAAAAARLLMQHDLSMDEVSAPGESGIIQEEIPLSTRNPASWQTSIGLGIQVFFGVALIHCKPPHTRQSSRILFIGRSVDVSLATWLFSRLQRDLLRRCLLELTASASQCPKWRREFRDSWLESAALAVARRLINARRAAAETVSTANALVVRYDQAIAQYIQRELGSLGRARPPQMKTRSAHGMDAGAKYGAEVSIAVNAIEPRPQQVRFLERSRS